MSSWPVDAPPPPLDLLWTARLPDGGGEGAAAVVHVEGREAFDTYHIFLSIVRTDLAAAWAADFTLDNVVTSLPTAEEAAAEVAQWIRDAAPRGTLVPAGDTRGLRLALPDKPLAAGGLARYELPPGPGAAAAPLVGGAVAKRVGTVLAHAARIVAAAADAVAQRDATISALTQHVESQERALAKAGRSPVRARAAGARVAAAGGASAPSQTLPSPPPASQVAAVVVNGGGLSQPPASQAAGAARLGSTALPPPPSQKPVGLAPAPQRPVAAPRPGVQVVKKRRAAGAPTAARGAKGGAG